MNRYKIKKVVSAFMIGTLIAVTVPVVPERCGSAYADELSDAEEKKSEATQKKKEAEAKLAELETAKSDILDVIEQLDNEISGYEEKIAVLTSERNSLQASAAVTENSLQDAYIAESNQYSSMKDRIQFAYENGDAEYIQALLSIKDYSTVTNQSEYVDKVSVYDRQQLRHHLSDGR